MRWWRCSASSVLDGFECQEYSERRRESLGSRDRTCLEMHRVTGKRGASKRVKSKWITEMN